MNENAIFVAMWIAIGAIGVAFAVNVKDCESNSSVVCVKYGGEWVPKKGLVAAYCQAKKK